MVRIRLSRGGSKKDPRYRIVVADGRRWRDGRFIEVLGQYIPSPKGSQKGLLLNKDRASYWISKGARPSVRLAKLMKT